MANAAVDLTTLATLKARLSLSGVAVNEADNGELERLITAASQRMHNEIGSSVIYAARVDTKSGNGGTRVFLNDCLPPAGEDFWSCDVTSVVVDEVTIPAYVKAAGAVAQVDGWRLVDKSRIDLVGTSYRFTRAPDAFASSSGNVVITYSAGFKVTPWSIPSDIEGAVCEVAALWWKERERIGQTVKSVGGESVNFQGSNVWSTFFAVAKSYYRQGF